MIRSVSVMVFLFCHVAFAAGPSDAARLLAKSFGRLVASISPEMRMVEEALLASSLSGRTLEERFASALRTQKMKGVAPELEARLRRIEKRYNEHMAKYPKASPNRALRRIAREELDFSKVLQDGKIEFVNRDDVLPGRRTLEERFLRPAQQGSDFRARSGKKPTPAEAEEEISEYKAEIDEIRGAVSDLESEFDELEALYPRDTVLRSGAEDELSAIEAQIDSLLDRQAHLEGQIDWLIQFTR